MSTDRPARPIVEVLTERRIDFVAPASLFGDLVFVPAPDSYRYVQTIPMPPFGERVRDVEARVIDEPLRPGENDPGRD